MGHCSLAEEKLAGVSPLSIHSQIPVLLSGHLPCPHTVDGSLQVPNHIKGKQSWIKRRQFKMVVVVCVCSSSTGEREEDFEFDDRTY